MLVLLPSLPPLYHSHGSFSISVGSKSTHEKPAANGSVIRSEEVKLDRLTRKGAFPWSSETDGEHSGLV